MFGLFLVTLGIFLLMEKAGLIQGDFWGYFWPLLLIIFGLSAMSKGKCKTHDSCFSFGFGSDKHHKHHDKHGKVVDDQ